MMLWRSLNSKGQSRIRKGIFGYSLTLGLALTAALCVGLHSTKSFAQDDDFDLELEEADAYSAPEEDRLPEPEPILADSLNLEPFSETTSSQSFGETDGSFPKTFHKPEGPKGGGVIKAPHPNAAKGLIRIQKDGSYIYKTPMPEKSKAASFRFGYLTSPSIESAQNVNFQDIYGADGLVGLMFDYEWQPFRGFGALGFQLGGGIVVARGNGRFAGGAVASEIYTLGVVPLSANIVYRFEYVRRQWAVPFVSAGGIAYGLAEVRDDGRAPTFGVAPAVSGGGGVHFNITRWDSEGAFILAQDYGVADLWLTVDAKVIQGLDPQLDFTNQTISAGFTIDY